MPATYVLKPEIIKHLRKQRKLKQLVVANSIGITERGYQKVEKTGRTTPGNAEKLAQVFDTSLAFLKGDQELPLYSSYWFYTSKDERQNKAGRILYGDREVCGEVDSLSSQIAPYFPSEKNEISVSLSKDDQGYFLSVTGGRSGEFWMRWRRVELDLDRGLVWTYESEWEAGFMQRAIDDLLFNVSTRYIRYGDSMPPAGMKEVFCVDVITKEFLGKGQGILEKHIGWKSFDEESSVTNFIIKFVNEFNPSGYEIKDDFLRTERGCVLISLTPFLSLRDPSIPFIPGTILQIRRSWVNEEGGIKGCAPWHRRSIECLKQQIREGCEQDRGQGARSRMPELPLEPGLGEILQ
ncbi:helix-turn-helix domain-containing protein [Marinobacterium mangrovicola]|uniref:Helix-turn-helix protein n=1 Tax=Marinobacterium mangrovicola TaxID=1476959 RepID=A0A4R1GJS7_9GAMM|nr:helix-turn-helix transcriptional regulator [Marinobacterium mangrovicola]TCK07450.1 helix-turn-helix protein [Marinobacterium mangrovicola]